ncbi:hypothetical protein WMY93_011024 [Mugilogobius chulae]|uniref:EF-hand domain-containing protein n=1 Tax=Mugilogobius chulae TaxID=88201 RepID=A0AAW0P8X6_9GOBI
MEADSNQKSPAQLCVPCVSLGQARSILESDLFPVFGKSLWSAGVCRSALIEQRNTNWLAHVRLIPPFFIFHFPSPLPLLLSSSSSFLSSLLILLDPENTGFIPVENFTSLVEHHELQLDPSKLDMLLALVQSNEEGRCATRSSLSWETDATSIKPAQNLSPSSLLYGLERYSLL